jgi:hypothetical protein
MRRLVAILLVLCCGVLVPAAVGQLRLCTEDLTLRVSAFEAPTQAAAEDACCDDCSKPAPAAPCCIKVAKLPASTAPSPQEALPTIVSWDAAPIAFAPVLRLLAGPAVALGAEALHAPPAACAVRALLEVWRI